MIPVGPVTTLNRSILLTERRMSGTGGDDFICGHCGHVMLEDFDPSTIKGNPVYQCGVCETTMTYHSPPVMVAIGLLGDDADRNQLATTRWNCHANRDRSFRPDASETAARVGDPHARKSAQIYQYRR